MHFVSDRQRKACFAKLNKFSGVVSVFPEFSEFNKKTNKEMFDGIKHRLKEKTLRDFIKEIDKEFHFGMPKNCKENISSLFDGRDSYFYDGVEHNKFSSRFANRFPEDFVEGKSFDSNSAIKFDIDPVKYTNTIIIEEAIRNYEMNQSYYDKYGISKDDIIMIELAKNSLLGQETEKNNISDKEI